MFTFNVIVTSGGGVPVRNLMTKNTSVILTNLQSNEQYTVSVTTISGSCASNSAEMTFTVDSMSKLAKIYHRELLLLDILSS